MGTREKKGIETLLSSHHLLPWVKLPSRYSAFGARAFSKFGVSKRNPAYGPEDHSGLPERDRIPWRQSASLVPKIFGVEKSRLIKLLSFVGPRISEG